MADEKVTLQVAGREVVLSSPHKVYFPQAGITKLELVQYYLDVADAVLVAVRNRPMVLKRFVNGVEQEAFFQKRAPKNLPPFVTTATFHYASGLSADECVITDAAGLAWIVNLGCVEMHVHTVRADDMDHPDEMRVDLDPVPGVSWAQVLEVARVAREVLNDMGLVGWPKTSGSRGVHIWARIEPRWTFAECRRAALTFAREVERRAPHIATSKWAKEERHGVLVDYNQNARDRTTASAYSVRPLPDARVSMPLSWDALLSCKPEDYTLKTVPALVKAHGDAHAGIDAAVGTLDKLLALADELDPPKKRAPKKTKSDGPTSATAGGQSAAPAKAKRVKLPVITIAQAKHKPEALEGLERWKAAHPDVVALLAPEHIIVDANRGRSSAWYRVRINLVNVPEAMRPPQGTPDPNYDWKTEIAAFMARVREQE